MVRRGRWGRAPALSGAVCPKMRNGGHGLGGGSAPGGDCAEAKGLPGCDGCSCN